MAAPSSHHQNPTQTFRACEPSGAPSCSPRIVTIKAHKDLITGQYIILWKHIKEVFKNVQYVMNGDLHVALLTDANFEDLVPERISYHPGAVLDVVLDVAPKDMPPHNTPSRPQMPPPPDSSASVTTLVESPYAKYECEEYVLTKQCDPMDEDFVATYTQGIMSGRITEAKLMSMFQGFEEDRIRTNNFQINTTDRLQKILNNVTYIKKRIEHVISQNYELHEYPIPRLFIVLPRDPRRRDWLLKPFKKQFRLYFLCECGEHTSSKESRIFHKIHLAKHEGYDLDRPTEFFAKYGRYALTMLQMVQTGCKIAGMVVPALNLFSVEGVTDKVEKSLDAVRASFGSVVDEMITYIQGLPTDSSYDPERTDGQLELAQLEALAGADLRQLESFLEIKDEGRVLGNLYRIVTGEGHVKWVCIDHYRENYRDMAMVPLRKVVESNGGVLNEQYGRIKISVSSRDVAKKFYEAMVKARGIRELDMSLAWDVTTSDLRELKDAVSKAIITHLTLNGSSLQSPSKARGLISASRRFEPIIELMSNLTIQSLRLEHFDDFFSRITNVATKVSQLKVLSIDAKIPLKEGSPSFALEKTLENCPSLTELTLRSDCVWTTYSFVTRLNPNHKLNKMVLKFAMPSMIRLSDSTITIRFSQGKILAAIADLSNIHDVTSQSHFLNKGLLTELKIRHISTDASSVDRLAALLRCSPKIDRIEVTSGAGSFHNIFSLIKDTRQKMISDRLTSALRELRLQTHDPGTESDGNHHIDAAIMTVFFSGTSGEFDMSTDVRMSSQASSSIASGVANLLDMYGWSIKKLVAGKSFSNYHVELLEKYAREGDCGPRHLRLDLTSVTQVALEKMDSVVDWPDYLEDLQMEFQELGNAAQQEKIQRCLIQYGDRLNGLTLRGDHAAEWLTSISKMLPERRYLPKLNNFEIVCVKRQSVPTTCAKWLAGILQAPVIPPTAATPSSPQSDPLVSPSWPWMPLRDVRLENMEFSADDWNLIIQAVDFSTLETLSFENTNFGLQQMRVLTEVIPQNGVEVSLKSLHVKGSALARCRDMVELKEVEIAFKEKTLVTEIKDFPLI
ncbi:hypothetical protein BC939DRAFT_481303 [Gamsiella multidivaricata]|uniref:uncharacterized protein n=1 Tax=Gamsiella multidivaricata TaxID=101098 RepID=UPI00221F4033|nr:uncharacterized protein BC939DRAFT_481303 [Gamsiella multidivaricata]KAG0367825.1 hypothetical protein BGZ54_003200 [Gamsiella multidivaricata]KAI7817292.1 hypothetical protein BC939DRAFT_481303 [Gamsiella multidivaricata]